MKARSALDTSVVVAAHMDWHVHHERARRAIRDEGHAGRRRVLPVPALTQAFSVMTRLPRPKALLADAARDILRTSYAGSADLVGLDGDAFWELLDRAVARNVLGGGIHDADILACAERAGAKRLLTLNPAAFHRLGPTSVQIVEP